MLPSHETIDMRKQLGIKCTYYFRENKLDTRYIRLKYIFDMRSRFSKKMGCIGSYDPFTVIP